MAKSVSQVPEFPPFTGFPAGAVKFLAGLSKHNDKAWFEAHKPDSVEFYLKPAQSFVAAIGPKLAKVSPSVHYQPRVNGSIGRIYRDTRFSHDKTPYKDHLDLWFWHGTNKGWDCVGFWFRLRADQIALGVGMHHWEKHRAEQFRAAVQDDAQGKALDRAVAKVTKAGFAIGGATRKTVPRGMDAAHPRAEYFKHEGLFAYAEEPLPAALATPKFVDWCADRYKAMWPIGAWLMDVMEF